MVSEFMLQQTQVATVVPYFERWMERFPSFVALAAAAEEEVLSLWQGLGYYSRARRLHEAAIKVCRTFGGELPSDVETIATLPGVGRYTAGAIAAFAFDRAVPTVDGNIARVLARLVDFQQPIDSAGGQRELWESAVALLPTRGGRIHTSALMELGALLCTVRNPQCLICPVRDHCAADEPETLPRKRPRPRVIAIDEGCGWLVQDDRILLEQQTGPRWRGLWKLPKMVNPLAEEPIFRSVYPFTNHRVILRVHRMSAPPLIEPPLAWLALSEIASLPLAAPHRRAIVHLLGQSAS
jgi:A/G-specific adenine glycosylase